ncbi:hypothetical protein BCR36DRAFT_586341 [Piromyces finnis]|uniref:MSP domain-containing protein n=1 Tax=Piromyces finnis TaxID=1754191 RepID=A0A1Y1V204_9FUNG|nr:hypothetical protein BCR36DRAFT_586341 [Piromyces finnis]|eukprot:ORX44218.1 hypothetical protein BCR36DRAFT_586341 [Piromyces finnis]
MKSPSNQDNCFTYFNVSSNIDINTIEKEYEDKINDITTTSENKLKDIINTKDFINSSWDSLKTLNIKNTINIINYYGPIYQNLSWPTEYIVPEFDNNILKRNNLICWSNNQINDMINSNISKFSNSLKPNADNDYNEDSFHNIYEVEQIVNNNFEEKINYIKSKGKNNSISKKYINKNKSLLKSESKYSNKMTLSNTLSTTLSTYKSTYNKIGLVAYPSKICFDNFEPYKSYSAIIIIKNVTYETQRIQVTFESEENEKFFRIYKIYSPGENGLISPGLSAHFKIVFNPLSLKAHYATVNVSSSFGDKLLINVLAKIKEPIIDIPPVLNCNPCIVNSASTTDIIIKNSGGKGKFIIIDWDDSRSCETFHDIKLNNNYKNYIYKKGSFKIVPGYCEIKENEKIHLKVYYKPKYKLDFKKNNKALSYIEDLRICLAWDNCEKQEITIKGIVQEPCIAIESNDELIEKKSYLDINTNKEIIYSNVMDFDTCNINSEIIKIVKLKNMTDVMLPVIWNIIDTPINSMNVNNLPTKNNIYDEYSDILNNNIKTKNLIEEKSKKDNKVNTQNYNIGKKVLKIFPQEVIFKPQEIIEFKFKFKPKNYKHYDIIAQLLYNKHLNLIEDNLNDNEIICIRCKGKAEPVKTEVIPPIINIPRTLSVDENYVKEVSIYNSGKAAISYTSTLNNESIEIVSMKLSNSNGIIEAGSSVKLYLSIKGSFPGKFKGNIMIYFNNYKSNKVIVNINGEINYKLGSFIFDKKIIDFGIIQLGSCAKECLFFTNNSNSRINWKINLYTKNKEKCDYLALFEPKNGLLESKKSIKIDIVFIPLWYQLFRGEIVCELINEKYAYSEDVIQNNEFVLSPQKFLSHSIRLQANVLTPKVLLLNNNRRENCTCYLNIEKELFVTLKNITLLPTHYKILPVNNNNIDIKFEKDEGVIKGDDEINIKMYVKGRNIGNFDDIVINAIIDGMVENNGKLSLNFNLDIKGLDVNIEIYNSIEDFENKIIDQNNCLNYGNNCKLFTSYTKYIRIINTFQVESKFEISLDKYNINYEAIDDNDNKSNSKGLILKPKNDKKMYFYSENGQRYIKEKISKKENIKNINKIIFDKYDVGFKIAPRTGILKPYDVVTIEVTAYNNISGIYNDMLTIKVSNGIEKTIPVTMEVKGVPLTYINLLSPRENDSDIKELFFSTRLISSSNVDFNKDDYLNISNNNNKVTKTICILNESPKNITLSWEFLISKTNINESKEFKSIINKNNELINMSLELLQKVTTISSEVLEVKQILEGDKNSNSNLLCNNDNLLIESVNSLYDCNQTSFTENNNNNNNNYSNSSSSSSNNISNNSEEIVNSITLKSNEINKSNNYNNSEEIDSISSRNISILTLDFTGTNSFKLKENEDENKKEIESEIDIIKKKEAEMMNAFLKKYQNNTYDIFDIKPKIATIKSNEKMTFKVSMKNTAEGIYDGLLYSRLTYENDSKINEKEQFNHDDIRDIINDVSITKLHLFGIITVPRLKFENNLDYYHINLKYSNKDEMKTFNIINPSENVYIFKMMPSNDNIILGYTNNIFVDDIINNSTNSYYDQKRNIIVNNNIIIQLRAYETKLITVKLKKDISIETYNSLKELDLKIRIDFINGVYQIIPISIL